MGEEMSMVKLPDGTPSALFEIKPVGDGRFFLEAFGFKSMPFDLKDIRENKEYFSQTIHGQVLGTVQ